jgi:hypothetical protein
MDHCVSYARRYAEQGDYEMSDLAFQAMANLCGAYVNTKGKTFFTRHLMFENPHSTDALINDTLEHLRQLSRLAISRRDEQHIEQLLRTLFSLVRIFGVIDYATEDASKIHAHLAAGYLGNEIQAIAAHNMPDVLMEGVRLLGESGHVFLTGHQPGDMTSIADKIALIGCLGAAREDYRPVTVTSMEQLARLSFNLLRVESHDIGFVAQKLKKNVSLIVTVFLNVPDTPFASVHSMVLQPYYGLTSSDTFGNWLRELANSLLQAKANNKDASRVVHNIAEWSEDLYHTEKELLLQAVKQQSHFAFDMIHWITHVTKVLIAISNAPACDEYTKKELEKHASWLIAVLSWIPTDSKEVVGFVENFRVTEELFEAAADAVERSSEQVADSAGQCLLGWAVNAGAHRVGWAILERGMYGVATLALLRDDPDQVEKLKAALSKRLSQEGAPSQEIRDDVARDIRRRAASLPRQGHWSSYIERAMGQIDHQRLKSLLEEIADILSPDTSNEPVEPDPFL